MKLSSVSVRPILSEDIEYIRQIHDKYYSQFDFPDFYRDFIFRFAITDGGEGPIIIAGGVRTIGESILITDQTQSRIKIGRALVEAQKLSLYGCHKCDIDELHAFTDNEQYIKHLRMHGFEPRSRCFSMKVPDYGQK